MRGIVGSNRTEERLTVVLTPPSRNVKGLDAMLYALTQPSPRILFDIETIQTFESGYGGWMVSFQTAHQTTLQEFQTWIDKHDGIGSDGTMTTVLHGKI